jgi:hypothetical protein
MAPPSSGVLCCVMRTCRSPTVRRDAHHSCRTARGPPNRLMRPVGTVVIVLKTILRPRSHCISLTAILPAGIGADSVKGPGTTLVQASRIRYL